MNSQVSVAKLQWLLLLGVGLLVAILFMLPAHVTGGLSVLRPGPAVMLASLISGNAHSFTGPVYFFALTVEFYVSANVIWWIAILVRWVFACRPGARTSPKRQ